MIMTRHGCRSARGRRQPSGVQHGRRRLRVTRLAHTSRSVVWATRLTLGEQGDLPTPRPPAAREVTRTLHALVQVSPKTEALIHVRTVSSLSMTVIESRGFSLARIDEHNWRAALAVEVTPDQLRFVAGHQPVALVILAKAYQRPGGLDWEPLAVSQDGTLVAVVALAHASAHT